MYIKYLFLIKELFIEEEFIVTQIVYINDDLSIL